MTRPLREVLNENRDIVRSASEAADKLTRAASRADEAVKAIEGARIAAKWLVRSVFLAALIGGLTGGALVWWLFYRWLLAGL